MNDFQVHSQDMLDKALSSYRLHHVEVLGAVIRPLLCEEFIKRIQYSALVLCNTPHSLAETVACRYPNAHNIPCIPPAD